MNTHARLRLLLSLLAAGLVVLPGCGTWIPAKGRVEAIRADAAPVSGVTASTTTDATAESGATDLPATVRLDPESTLRLAFRHSRALQARRDSLAAAALDLLEQRRAFGPQLSGELAGRLEFAGDNDGFAPSGTAVFSDVLPTAAKFRVDGSTAQTPDREEGDWDSRVKARIDQPLLAGAGYEASHEALIQAQRDLVQRLRQFEIDRQDLAIEVLDAFYKLVGLRSQLDNARTALERSEFALRRSEAMFKVQLAPYIDVARSQQQAISSQRRLEDAQLRYDSAEKRILLQLGLPPETGLELTAVTPQLIPLAATIDECETAALDRRLDLRNALDSVEDAARRLRTARGNRWPDLALFAEAGRSGQGTGAFQADDPEDSAAAGLALQIDPDRRDQRDALERARILLAAAERDATLARDEARVEVFEETERLTTVRRQVALGEENLAVARRRYENAMLRFEAGELGNRDVVEAENGLLDARNTLVDTAISHEIARLRLLARIGLLDVGPEGALLDASGPSTPPRLFGPPEPLRIPK